MSEFKGTPGPWHVVEAPSAPQFWVVQDPGTWVERVCAVPDYGRLGEANARLIAAAPELLEALQRLSVLADEIWVKYSDHEAALMREAWTAADAAIAKALGEGQ